MKYSDTEKDAYDTGYRDAINHELNGVNPPERNYYGSEDDAYRQGMSDGYDDA